MFVLLQLVLHRDFQARSIHQPGHHGEQRPSVRGVLGLREQTQHGDLLHHGGAPGWRHSPRGTRGSTQRWRSRLERAVHRVLRVPLPESVKHKYSIYCDLNVHLRFNIVRLTI